MVRSNRTRRESTVLFRDSPATDICHKDICGGDTRTQKEKQLDRGRQANLFSSTLPPLCTYHEKHTNNDSTIAEQRPQRERRPSVLQVDARYKYVVDEKSQEKQKDSLLHKNEFEIGQANVIC